MIEISMTELALLIWAVGATAAWMHSRDELKGAKRFLRAMIEDADIRDKVVGQYKEFKAKGEL